MRWLLKLLLMFAIYTITMAASTAQVSVPVNVTENSWIYNQGYMNDQRIYQTEPGFYGQKLVSGTQGSGMVSRTISAGVYGGNGNDECSPTTSGDLIKISLILHL